MSINFNQYYLTKLTLMTLPLTTSNCKLFRDDFNFKSVRTVSNSQIISVSLLIYVAKTHRTWTTTLTADPTNCNQEVTKYTYALPLKKMYETLSDVCAGFKITSEVRFPTSINDENTIEITFIDYGIITGLNYDKIYTVKLEREQSQNVSSNRISTNHSGVKNTGITIAQMKGLFEQYIPVNKTAFENLHKENTNLGSRLNQVGCTNSSLNRENSDLKSTLKEMNEELERSKSVIKERETLIVTLNDLKCKQNSDLSASEVQISELRRDLAILKINNSIFEKELVNQKIIITSYEEQLNKKNEIIFNLETNKSVLEKDLSLANLELQVNRTHIDTLKQDSFNLQNDNVKLQEIITNLQKNSDSLILNNRELQEKYDKLLSKVDELIEGFNKVKC
jgi:hypothetical protein